MNVERARNHYERAHVQSWLNILGKLPFFPSRMKVKAAALNCTQQENDATQLISIASS